MNTWLRREYAVQAFVPRGQILPQGQFSCPAGNKIWVSQKAESFFGTFITCCEDDRLERLLQGKVFHIQAGNVLP